MKEITLDNDVAKRFYDKVKIDLFNMHGCHIWQSTLSGDYGQFWLNGKTVYAHIVAYRLYYGDFSHSRNSQVDHLCKNPRCVNPLHLEQVSMHENILRSDGPAGKNARKTHCKHGHELTPANTYKTSAGRRCRTCRSKQNRERYLGLR